MREIYLLRSEKYGYYLGASEETNTPHFSSIAPVSHYCVVFNDLDELNSHINLKEFEKSLGKYTIVKEIVENWMVKSNRYISVEYLAKYVKEDNMLIPLLAMMPVEGYC